MFIENRLLNISPSKVCFFWWGEGSAENCSSESATIESHVQTPIPQEKENTSRGEKEVSRAMKVKVAQSGPTLCDPMDCSPPGSSVHGTVQARILEWVAIPFSRGSSQPRDWIEVSCIAGSFSVSWATKEINKESMAFHWLSPCQVRRGVFLLPVELWYSHRAWELFLLVSQLYLVKVSVYFLCSLNWIWCIWEPHIWEAQYIVLSENFL